jgi:eukaryotic-like serine/threonine-protein kinase
MLRFRRIIVPVILVMLLTVLSCRKKKNGSDDVPPPPPKSSVKTINSFVIAAADNSTVTPLDITGQIGNDTITVTFDEGLNLTSVLPTIGFSGASLSPQSRTLQNFSNPLSYTVTAEDGSTKKYFIKVNLIRGNSVVYVGSDDDNLYALNAGTGTLRWKYTAGGNIQSSPVVVNNTVYFGSFDNYLYAVNASTGILKWRYKTDYPITNESPVIGGNAVFISSSPGYPYGHVYSIDTATGLLKWKSINVSIPYGPLYAEGKVFVCSFPDGCSAFDALTGIKVWNVPGGISRGNPLYYNGKIYFCGEGTFYCVNASNGSIVWTKSSMFPSLSSPTIDNGVLYCVSGAYMVAIDPGTGAEQWRRQSNGGASGSGPGLFSSPVVAGSIIYADNNDSYFYALSTLNGSNIWTKGNSVIAAGVAMGSPTVANGVVFIGRYDSHIYAYDAITGNQRWKFQANGALLSGPCVVDTRGEVYFSGISGAKN